MPYLPPCHFNHLLQALNLKSPVYWWWTASPVIAAIAQMKGDQQYWKVREAALLAVGSLSLAEMKPEAVKLLHVSLQRATESTVLEQRSIKSVSSSAACQVTRNYPGSFCRSMQCYRTSWMWTWESNPATCFCIAELCGPRPGKLWIPFSKQVQSSFQQLLWYSQPFSQPFTSLPSNSGLACLCSDAACHASGWRARLELAGGPLVSKP